MPTPRENVPPLSLPFANWRHFKEAFSPAVVYDAIGNSDITVHSCIDPFGGSGTTALACQFAGVAPTTVEVNPYLADLIEAKLLTYDIDGLVRDLGTVLNSADVVDPSPRSAPLPKTFVEPGANDRWLFDREVADRVLSIAMASDELAVPSHRRLFRVLLAGTLVTLSNVTINGKGRRYRGGWQKNRRTHGDVDFLFTQAASAAIVELRRAAPRASTAYTLIRGDARYAIQGVGPFDIAVFSPPYPNSFDYTDVYNIELWMLGYLDGRATNWSLRQSTLSSHVQLKRDFVSPPSGSPLLEDTLGPLRLAVDQLWNRQIPEMVGAYFAEMLNILVSLRSALRAGGRIWIVVGDSSYAGVPIHVAKILAELACTQDLSIVRIERLREMRKSAQQGGQVQLEENLLVLSRV